MSKYEKNFELGKPSGRRRVATHFDPQSNACFTAGLNHFFSVNCCSSSLLPRGTFSVLTLFVFED